MENPKRASRVDRSSPRTWKRSSLALDGTETRGYAGLRSCLSVRGLSVVETVSGQSSRSHPSRGSPQRGPRTHAVLSVASSLAPVEGG